MPLYIAVPLLGNEPVIAHCHDARHRQFLMIVTYLRLDIQVLICPFTGVSALALVFLIADTHADAGVSAIVGPSVAGVLAA